MTYDDDGDDDGHDSNCDGIGGDPVKGGGK